MGSGKGKGKGKGKGGGKCADDKDDVTKERNYYWRQGIWEVCEATCDWCESPCPRAGECREDEVQVEASYDLRTGAPKEALHSVLYQEFSSCP